MSSLNQLCIFICCLLSVFQLIGQDQITWGFEYNAKEEQLEFKASLKKGWHIYSQFLDENAGPIATTFELEANKAIVFEGITQEPKGEEVYDKNFGSVITYFSDEVTFYQAVSVNQSVVVKGSVLFMICDDNGCLPPDLIEFEIPVNASHK